MHHINCGQFFKGRHPYVFQPPASRVTHGTGLTQDLKDLWPLTRLNLCCKMRMARYRVPGLLLPVSVLDLPNRCWQSPLSKASRRSCTYPAVTLTGPVYAPCCEACASWFGERVTDTVLCHRIDDRKAAKPRMRGFIHGSMLIFRERGVRGFFQGFVPTTARQAANSATRFGSYTTLRQLAEGYVSPGEKLGTMSTFGIGGVAGLITVYALKTFRNVYHGQVLMTCYRYVTQPLDTVKTR